MARTESAHGGSDAIAIGEEWISEHYFTTDATKESFKARVTERRKAWEAEKDSGTPRTRFTAARARLLSAWATVADADSSEVAALNHQLFTVLGFDRGGLLSKEDGPATFVHAVGIDQPCVAVVDALPGDGVEALLDKDADNLVTAYEVDETEHIASVARLVSHLFVSDERRPAFVLVLAGPHALLAERERWPEGRYLAVNLQLVAERNDDKRGGEVDRALTCLAADSLAPDAEGDIWWTGVLEESVKHTVGVSKDLREGVRLSVEIIANEVVARRKRQGLDPLPQSEAQPLAKQSLRFLYRILFLLYAEASPELGVLPSGAPEYERGYSLDRLRELVQVPLTSPSSRHGRHLHDSLGTLFRLVDQGHDPGEDEDDVISGLEFRSLRADLFKREATAFIDEVGLGNAALQQVLQHLLLSKKQSGRDRGFISYAELGINQLGAVYEGLMSYTGFFAETDLYEVAKDGNAEKGSWVVPTDRAEGIAAKDFVMTEDPDTGEPHRVLHERGSFVYRLAGRERQQSASYYTPEVLTRFVVSQALEELLDQDGRRTTAEEVLRLTVCEPALGSGAFAIEAVRQLAEEYLTRRQAELGETIDPDDYPRELQRVKAWLALHQVYGVDLNATAVELAEISLWLDTMVADLHAPWFGLHLRRGNSLIGARKQVFTRKQVEDKSFLKAVPTWVGTGENAVPRIFGHVPHFLLPAEGWGSAAEVGKDIRELAPDRVKGLKAWRKTLKAKPSRKQVDRLVELGERVERLWEIATRRLTIAEHQVRRDLDLWGQPAHESMSSLVEPVETRHVTREEIEESLADPEGAYQRLRLVMDAWCALWFWPLTESDVAPPTLQQWYDALRMILGGRTMSKTFARKGDDTFETLLDWDELGEAETNDRIYAGATPMSEVLAQHPWLRVCHDVAARQGFFHWELDFASVFERGGFDLQTGNPPWVRPIADVDALLAEGDPWWQLANRPSQQEVRKRRESTLDLPGVERLVVTGTADVTCTAEFVGDAQLYPHLVRLQPDLYRCFMEQTWTHASTRGVVGLIHPESHFTDEKAGLLRAGTYRRLRRHWQFMNALFLFDVHDQVSFGVHIYGAIQEPDFLMATSLYHPDTAERSLVHDGSGDEPGLKLATGGWDLRPHRSRVLAVSASTLNTWHELLEEPDTPKIQSRMVYTVNRSSEAVLHKLARQRRVGSLGLEFSPGWHEKGGRTKGYFESEWGRPGSWRDVILQGPHLFVGTTLYKQPNETMLHNQDWSSVDLETLPADAVPVTSYKPRGNSATYAADYTHWGAEGSIPARDCYRVAWRAMAANTGERTLIPALIPPGTAHINGVFAMGFGEGDRHLREIVLVQALASSMMSDFLIRAVPKSGIYQGSFERLPFVDPPSRLREAVLLRTLRVNCLTAAYAKLWGAVAPELYGPERMWTGGIDYPGRADLADVTNEWTTETPLRRDSDRRQALLEIDAVVALSLGLTADELCTIYRTQFPVLYGYDRRKYLYDANGRVVPNEVLSTWRRKGLDRVAPDEQVEAGSAPGGSAMDEEERTALHPGSGVAYTYELPYVTLDREADMRQAYAHFERVLAERDG